MAFIARTIIEARIDNLTKKRDEALQKKDYDRVWILNMNIDKNVNRLISFSY